MFQFYIYNLLFLQVRQDSTKNLLIPEHNSDYFPLNESKLRVLKRFAYIHLDFLIYFISFTLHYPHMFHLSYAMIGKKLTKQNLTMIFRSRIQLPYEFCQLARSLSEKLHVKCITSLAKTGISKPLFRRDEEKKINCEENQ